jgi:hypothetical protein
MVLAKLFSSMLTLSRLPAASDQEISNKQSDVWPPPNAQDGVPVKAGLTGSLPMLWKRNASVAFGGCRARHALDEHWTVSPRAPIPAVRTAVTQRQGSIEAVRKHWHSICA